MGDKHFKGAPFGTQKSRFDIAGVHPESKTPGTYTEVNYCTKSMHTLNRHRGPGRYYTEVGGFSTQSVEERASGPGWARAFEVARMAKMPHLLHKEQWELKKLLTKKLGPGTYEFKDFLQESEERPSSIRGVCGTRANRFKDLEKETGNWRAHDTTPNNCIPGPGTYGKGGIPNLYREEKEKIPIGNITVMDGAVGNRGLPSVGSHLGPGTYNFKSSAEQLKEKVTSSRGPYDLFTGDRNKPIMTGHFAKPNNANLGPGQYELKSFVEDMSHKHHNKHGKFSKLPDQHPIQAERIFCHSLAQCPKDQYFPGPGSYESVELSKPGAKKSPGFLSSAKRDDKRSLQFFTRNYNPVGAGRYDIQKWEEAQHRNGHSSAFVSKSSSWPANRGKFMHERIRAKDVPKKDRIFIVKPETPGQYITKMDNQTAYIAQRAATIA